jgi:hypothetical protein
MKKMKAFLGLFLLASGIMLTACSKDDEGSGLTGVPTGEIVAIGLRDMTLTGYSDLITQEGSQKWWTHVVSSFDFSSDDCGDDQTIENSGYYAFYPDGGYYFKSSIDSTPFSVGEWGWTDGSKTKIFISNSIGEGEFTVTYLNEMNIVFGSRQTGPGCSVVTYEQFNDPF